MLDKLAIFMILFYRNSLSLFMLHSCRFYPSCSHYAQEAIYKKGLFKAIPRILSRLLRCQPFSQGGYDPIT